MEQTKLVVVLTMEPQYGVLYTALLMSVTPVCQVLSGTAAAVTVYCTLVSAGSDSVRVGTTINNVTSPFHGRNAIDRHYARVCPNELIGSSSSICNVNAATGSIQHYAGNCTSHCIRSSLMVAHKHTDL